MFCRLLWLLLSVCLFAPLCGCDQGAGSPTDEQREPHFLVGKERVSSRDYPGAIEAFERALEVNPRNAHAHFELGLLYEQHQDGENHLISAMYHYKRALDLRPNVYPSEHARMRMAGCKQELVKSESLAPVYQTMQRDLERLKDENKSLKSQLESWQGQAGTRQPAPPPPNNAVPTPVPPSRSAALAPAPSTGVPPANSGSRVTPLPHAGSSRNYTVQPGDTYASIARSQKVRLESLQAANPSIPAKKLRPSQTLVIPAN